MRSLFSRVPDCGGNVVTGTQVHNQVRDSTTGSSSNDDNLPVQVGCFQFLQLNTFKFDEGQGRKGYCADAQQSQRIHSITCARWASRGT